MNWKGSRPQLRNRSHRSSINKEWIERPSNSLSPSTWPPTRINKEWIESLKEWLWRARVLQSINKEWIESASFSRVTLMVSFMYQQRMNWKWSSCTPYTLPCTIVSTKNELKEKILSGEGVKRWAVSINKEWIERGGRPPHQVLGPGPVSTKNELKAYLNILYMCIPKRFSINKEWIERWVGSLALITS